MEPCTRIRAEVGAGSAPAGLVVQALLRTITGPGTVQSWYRVESGKALDDLSLQGHELHAGSAPEHHPLIGQRWQRHRQLTIGHGLARGASRE
jgi:hypothetical protein